MERTAGLRRILASAPVYSFFQSLAGATRARQWLAANFWAVSSTAKVVDIGCGPGELLEYLPDGAEYLGIDPSEAYIARARRRFAGRPKTHFRLGRAGELRDDQRFRDADVVLCFGVLHHLDDAEALELLTLAKQALKPAGALRCVEPCFLVRQTGLSRWLMSLDRGGNIRSEEGWRRLFGAVFARQRVRIATGLIRLPYVHVLLEGFKP